MSTFALGSGLISAVWALPARGDITHDVQSGETVRSDGGTAHATAGTPRSATAASHSPTDAQRSHGVRSSTDVPGATRSSGDGKRSPADTARSSANVAHATRSTRASLATPLESRGRARKGVLYAIRLGEEFRIRVRDSRGDVPDGALAQFGRLSRQNGAAILPDPRLVALVGVVSDHFGGRPIEVVSGYRAYTPTQYTTHSNHNLGRALDFRIVGVDNTTLRDFCRTLRNAGCGYYPNSSFVHLDVRDRKAYWVDLSRPGEAPMYERSGSQADDGAGDVLEDHTGMGDSSSEHPPLSSAPHERPAARAADDSEKSL